MADFADDIFGLSSYEPRARPPREFLPWHRPRKQMVRREQWLKLTKQLLDEIPDGAGLNYLGLPGADLLDLRALHAGVCSDRTLRFLGFNSTQNKDQQITLDVSLQEVHALANVDPLSKVVRDDFRSLAIEQSQGTKAARTAGPFDIVNLDLCESVFRGATMDRSIYDALRRVFSLQSRRNAPWILFLTTRIDRSLVDDDVLDKLHAQVEKRIDKCDGFARELAALLGEDLTSPIGDCDDAKWVSLFSVSIASWLLSLSVHENSTIQLKSTMSYRVRGDASHDDLVSLALWIDPKVTLAPDPLGISEAQDDRIDECRWAEKIAKRAARRIAVDTVLADDAVLYEDLVAETAVLMTAARYNAAEYIAWARQDGASRYGWDDAADPMETVGS